MNPKYFLAALPFVAVFLGLYLFSNVWITTAVYHAGMLVTILISKDYRRLVQGWSTRWGLLIAGGLGVGLFFLMLAPRLSPGDIGVRMDALGLHGASLMVWAVYFSLVNPFLEEAFWRGTLRSDRKGIAAGDLLFAAYHILVLALFLSWPWLAVEFAILVGAAYLFRQCARSTQGLLVPTLAHLAVDISVGLTIWLLL
jgi:membrane protease YdiL (CAAX protease family)